MEKTKKDSLKAVPKLNEFLAEHKLLNPFDLVRLKHCMTENNINAGTAIQYLKMMPVEKLAKLLRENFSVHAIELGSIPTLGRLKNLIEVEKLKSYQVFPLNLIDDSGLKVLLLGMTDPLDTAVIRKVEGLCHLKVQPAFMSLDDLQSLLKKHFRSGLDLYPAEITYYGENTVKRRMEAVVGKKEVKPAVPTPEKTGTQSKEVRALVSLLVKKGILSWDEYEQLLSEL